MAKREDGFKPSPELPSQTSPWFATREENIRLSALNLAVQTKGSDDKVTLARKYLSFLMPEKDLGD